MNFLYYRTFANILNSNAKTLYVRSSIALEINKKSYYQSQFLSCRNDSGKMWKLINFLISSKEKSSCLPEKLFDPIKSNYTSNPEVMSNIFSTYFVSIGQQLASKIPSPVHHTYPVKVNGPKNSFVLHDTFVEEVNMVINNLLVSESKGKMIFQLTFLNCVRIPYLPSWCRYLIFA